MSEAKFAKLQKELFLLFEKGNLELIYAQIDKIEREFPQKWDKTSFWRACLFSIQGNTKEAVMVLDEALKKGFWWNPHTLTKDQDLYPLQHINEFKRIVKRCEEIFKHQNKTSRSELFVYGNLNSETGIFSLHWKASNVKEFAPYWLNGNLINDYLFGFPQSSQVYGYHSFCWDNEKIALDEISKTHQDFQVIHNSKRMIMAGASQGGKLAIELCLKDRSFNAQGFIAVIPAIKELSSFDSLLKTKKVFNLRGVIITGDQDPFFQKTIELSSLLESAGVECELMIKKGLGHYFPEDFNHLLSNAVNYILKLR